MSWVKFPNYINRLPKLRAALRVARDLDSRDLSDDEIYGYALLDAGVISSNSTVEELRKKPRANQGPITNGRGLPQMFQLLGMMVREAEQLRLTEAGNRIAEAEGEAVTDDEINLWRASVLNLQFPHEAIPERSIDGNFRPAHVMISMLELGPLPSQGLAFAFAAVDESPNEIQRLRDLAARWSDQDKGELAEAISVTPSELKNNAKVFPGLLEQVGLIRRSDGRAYVTTEGLEALGAGRNVPPNLRVSGARARRYVSRPIGASGPASWSPTPIDPEDAAERATLRLLRIERANAAHEKTVRILSDWMIGNGFATVQAEYDVLASRNDLKVLAEVKSLSATNGRRQTITAIRQLAYYYNGLVDEGHEPSSITRMVFFDHDPEDSQIGSVLDQEGIALGWLDSDDEVLFADTDFRQVLAGVE